VGRPRLTPTERALRAKSEKQWEGEVEGILRTFGWSVYHTHDSRHSASGFPDVVAIRARNADVLVAELKRETEDPTPEQLEWLRLFDLIGVDGYVWRPRDVDEVIERARRP